MPIISIVIILIQMILVHERYEDESQLWAAFVSELGRRAAVQHSSIDAEAALEQALAQSSLHQLTLGRSGRARRLALYEWRDLARALCPSHPLAALVWLHFFLRLFRVAPGYSTFHVLYYIFSRVCHSPSLCLNTHTLHSIFLKTRAKFKYIVRI